MGVSFRSKELLHTALTHPSATNEDPQAFPASNQRLEFLGDAFLDFVVAQELYQRLPHVDEGQLTELRSAVVKGDSLARIARELGVGDFLLLGQGERANGGADRPSNLAAAFEALVGALLLDSGPAQAYGPTVKLLSPVLDRVASEGVSRDPKSRLQEVAQGMGMESPVYRTVGESGPDHMRTFQIEVVVGGRVLGSGAGHRKADGERAAALEAIKALENPA